MSRPNRPAAARAIALAVVLPCLAASLGGCSLGGGSSKSGGSPAAAASPAGTITLRFATAEPSAVGSTFVRELGLLSGGRLHVVAVRYDNLATDVDQKIARDVAAGRLDVADVAARAWESLGATGLRAFQSPFLITSDALLDRVVADPRIVDSLLRSLAPLRVTGLALTPRDVRYLFAKPAAGPAGRVQGRAHPRQRVTDHRRHPLDAGRTPHRRRAQRTGRRRRTA